MSLVILPPPERSVGCGRGHDRPLFTIVVRISLQMGSISEELIDLVGKPCIAFGREIRDLAGALIAVP